jgi:serine protease
MTRRVIALFAAVALALSISAAEPGYGTAAVRAPSLWPFALGRGVRVAIIDTGIDATHPALQGAYRGGYDFVHNDSIPEEETADAHGTFVAGVVLQVAPAAEIYALKIYGRDNSFETPDLIRAIDWAIAHDIDVINMSFAMKVGLTDTQRAIDRAEAAGIVVVSAAGNAGASVDYPARFDNVIAVGAIGSQQQVADFSNRGPELDLVAPGVDIYSLALHGSGLTAQINQGPTIVSATAWTGSKTGEVTGILLDCGTGRIDQVPADMRGNVALMRIDDISTLGTRIDNVLRAGAAALVVVNDEPRFFYSNINPPGAVPPLASIGSDDALRLKSGETVHVVSSSGDYRFSWGTSFASPHVAGVVALLKELAPDARPAQIRNALFMSARDLGPTGRDDASGFGIVDAWAAAELLAPEKLPAIAPGRRRAVRH